MRLNQLWAPPSMELGTMHAETFRMLALGLVYAPVYPPAFLFTACALLLSFYATKFGIAHWYRKPAHLAGHLMKRMRNALLWLVRYLKLWAGLFDEPRCVYRTHWHTRTHAHAHT